MAKPPLGSRLSYSFYEWHVFQEPGELESRHKGHVQYFGVNQEGYKEILGFYVAGLLCLPENC